MTKTKKISVLIIGGGVAGLSAAAELMKRKVDYLLVEQTSILGGRTAHLCCKAVEACTHCGVCRLNDLFNILAIWSNKRIFTLGSLITARTKKNGNWEVELVPSTVPPSHTKINTAFSPWRFPLTKPLTIQAQAIILATGCSSFDSSLKTNFGYGRLPGVISTLDLEKTLAMNKLVPFPQRIAFIQCVGSRDYELEKLYCSRICCSYGLRLANLVSAQGKKIKVTFFYMDIQDYDRDWEAKLLPIYREIRFIRAIPGEIIQSINGKPEVIWSEIKGLLIREAFDLVVLSVGLEPSCQTKSLALMFGIAHSNADGFLGFKDQAVSSGVPRLFLAGTVRGPMSINESIAHASLAASEAIN